MMGRNQRDRADLAETGHLMSGASRESSRNPRPYYSPRAAGYPGAPRQTTVM
jgi:hypothetical protein